MATENDIKELFYVNGKSTAITIMYNIVADEFNTGNLYSCFREDLTDDEYSKFKEKYQSVYNNLKKKNFHLTTQDVDSSFNEVAPYLDINKVYLLFRGTADHYMKKVKSESDLVYAHNDTRESTPFLHSILGTDAPHLTIKNATKVSVNVESINTFIGRELQYKDFGNNYNPWFVFWYENGIGYRHYKNFDFFQKYSKETMAKMMANIGESDFYYLFDDVYTKRILQRKDFEIVRKNFARVPELETLCNIAKLEKLYLNYALNNYDDSKYNEANEKLEYFMKYYYDNLINTCLEIADYDIKNPDNIVDFSAEHNQISKFFSENVSKLSQNKEDFYTYILLAQNSKNIKSFKRQLVEEKLINSKDVETYLKLLYTNSKIDDKGLNSNISEFNRYGLEINPKNFEYNMSEHARAFLQNHSDEINKICKTNLKGVSGDELTASKINEEFYKKLYDKQMKEFDRNLARDFAENFAFEISNINENIFYNTSSDGKDDILYESLKYFYKNGYLDYDSVREFYGAEAEDPRSQNDIFKRFEKDGIKTRTEDLRDFDSPVHIIAQYELYQQSKGKKGSSGKAIVSSYIDGKITDQNFEEFLEHTNSIGETAKLFTLDGLTGYLNSAERSANSDDFEEKLEKYNLYKKYFNEYADRNEKKDFENFLKYKAKNINFSNKKDCIAKYKLNELTASLLDAEYRKVEDKMRISPSKNAQNQQDNLDELMYEMIKEQNILSDRDVETIFLDGSADVINNKKRLARIFSKHSVENSKDALTHQQISSVIFKMKPPENEYFKDFLKVEDEKHTYRNVGESPIPTPPAPPKPAYERTSKEFFFRKKFLESLDSDISTEIYGDVVAFKMPNRGKTVIEQFMYSSKDNSMGLTSKATYVLDNRLFSKFQQGEIANVIDGKSAYMFYRDKEDNKRIDWSVLSSIKKHTGVSRAIHNYKANSWEKSVLNRLGFEKKDAEEYIENYFEEKMR